MPPCLPTGCDPPAETKVEFFFPRLNDGSDVWYDISLVDGYSLAAEIIPSSQGGSCTATRCAMSLDACPQNERDVGDLRVMKNGRAVQCLSPCKKWNYPPYASNTHFLTTTKDNHNCATFFILIFIFHKI